MTFIGACNAFKSKPSAKTAAALLEILFFEEDEEHEAVQDVIEWLRKQKH